MAKKCYNFEDDNSDEEIGQTQSVPIFVGYKLPHWITVELLLRHFSSFEDKIDISRSTIINTPGNRHGKLYFVDKNTAYQAIEHLNNSSLNFQEKLFKISVNQWVQKKKDSTSPIRHDHVKKKHQDILLVVTKPQKSKTTVWVGENLPEYVTKFQLKNHFREVKGQIEKVTFKQTKSSTRVAFVEFSTAESCDLAVSKYNGTLLQMSSHKMKGSKTKSTSSIGREMGSTYAYAIAFGENYKERSDVDEMPEVEVHPDASGTDITDRMRIYSFSEQKVKNPDADPDTSSIASSVSNSASSTATAWVGYNLPKHVTEFHLRKHFREVNDQITRIMFHVTKKKTRIAYVEFSSVRACEQAVITYNLTELKGSQKIWVSKKGEKPAKEKHGIGRHDSEASIFFHQLPSAVNDNLLRIICSRYGTIISLNRDQPESALVTFSSPDSATTAVREVNGMQLGGACIQAQPVRLPYIQPRSPHRPNSPAYQQPTSPGFQSPYHQPPGTHYRPHGPYQQPPGPYQQALSPLTPGPTHEYVENITEDICVEQYKKALRENAHVTVGIVKAMTIGPPRVGKTCLRSLLLGRVPPRESPSTSVLKTAETVSMNTSSRKEPTIVSECISTSGWEVIDTTTGIISLLKYLQQGKHSRVGRGNEEVAQSRSRYPSSGIQSKDGKDDRIELSMSASQVETQELRHLDSCGIDDELAYGEKSFAEEIYNAISHSSDHAGVQLLDADLLQFLDTGGQISYHDILPVFITTPAIYLHVFSITEPLDKRPTDCIQLEGSGEWKSVTSPLTTLEMISRSAMTVHSLANKNMTLPCLVDEKYYPKPKMVVVGTHVDQFLEAHKSTGVVEDELSRISRKLDSALSGLKFSIVKSKLPTDNKERMFHPVDNYLYSKDTSRIDQQQKDTIENLRKEMEGIASRMKFTIPVPWYLQQLLLTKENEKTPFYRYGQLLELCKKNGVVKTDSEFYAMITLFHNLGLLVHHDVGAEPKEEGAHSADSTCLVFSNPSFLYENISRLYTVQFEECHGWKLSFRSQGLLQASVLKEINVDKRLPQKWFMDLLVTLFIGAEVTHFKERTLFVPSVLLPDKIPTSSNCCNKLSLMFEIPSAFPSHRNDTYIPCGVFTGTIARLQSLKDWRVSHFDLISRTMIIFEVGRGTFVQMTDSTQYITIEVLNDADVDTCQKLRNLVFNCIQESYKYLFKEDAQFLIGLPCPRKDHQSHIARLSTTGEYSRFVICCPTTRVLQHEKVLTEKELNIFLNISHPAVKKEYHTPRTITPKKSLTDNESKSPTGTGTRSPTGTIMHQPMSKPVPIAHPSEEWEKMKPSEIHLRRHICKNIVSNWAEVCTYLGVANEEMMTVMKNHPGNTKEIIFQSIMLWHRGTYLPDHPPTWSVLLKALEDAEYKELTKELREKLPSGKLED